jgi:hypothetical protein
VMMPCHDGTDPWLSVSHPWLQREPGIDERMEHTLYREFGVESSPKALLSPRAWLAATGA